MRCSLRRPPELVEELLVLGRRRTSDAVRTLEFSEPAPVELIHLDPCEEFGSELWLSRHLAPPAQPR